MPVSKPFSKVNLERFTNGIYASTMTMIAVFFHYPPGAEEKPLAE